MASTANKRVLDAAERGDVAGIADALVEGADPNAFEGTDDWTPLQSTACHSHIPAIHVLLAAGARVDGVDSNDITPLMYAAVNDRTAAVDALLAAGAGVNHADVFGDTALHRASMRGNLGAARVLVDAGARTDMRNVQHKLPIDEVCASLACSSPDGQRPINGVCASPRCPGAGVRWMRIHVTRTRHVCAADSRCPLVPPPPRCCGLLRGRVGVGGVG
jgi:hypothetical protein